MVIGKQNKVGLSTKVTDNQKILLISIIGNEINFGHL